MNIRALDTALDTLLGVEQAKLVRGLYQVLDATEKRVREEVEAKADGEYEAGFSHGYDAGYTAAKNAFYSPRQPEDVRGAVTLGAGLDVDQEALEQAVAALDSGRFYEGDSGDEDAAK